MVRLIKYELNKVLLTRHLLLIVVLIAISNFVLCFFGITSIDKEGISEKMEARIYSDMSSSGVDQIQQDLQERMTALYYADENANTQYTGDSLSEQRLLQRLEEHLQIVVNYDVFLNGVKENTNRILNSSIFSLTNPYSFRNAEATNEAYQSLNGLTVPFEYSGGVRCVTEGQSGDLLMTLLSVFFVLSLLIPEHETGSASLIFPTKLGRKHTVVAKLAALVILSLFSFVLIYGVRLAIGELSIGLGDLNRPLQSVDGYLTSPLTLSVGQFIFSFCLSKFIAFIAFSFMFFLCTLALRNVVLSCFAYGLFIAGEAALYLNILSTSWLSPLKQINIFALLDTQSYFMTYTNVNFAGIPINIIWVMLGTSMLGISVPLICSIIFYGSSDKRLEKMSIRLLHRTPPITQQKRGYPSSILYFEYYKILFTQKSIYVLALVMVLQLVCYWDHGLSHVDRDTYYYQSYAAILTGPQSEDRSSFLKNEQLKYAEAHAVIDEELARLQAGEIDLTAYTYLIKDADSILAGEKGFGLAAQQYQYTAGLENGEFIDLTSYNFIFEPSGQEEDIFDAAKLIFMLIICIAAFYSIEVTHHMNGLIQCTAKGMHQTKLAKIIAVVSISIVSTLIVFLPKYIALAQNLGFPHILSDARNIPTLHTVPPGLSILSFFIVLNFTRILSAASFGLLICWLSFKVVNTIGVILISMLIGLTPVLLYIMGVFNSELTVSYMPGLSGHIIFSENALIYFFSLLLSSIYLIYSGLKPYMDKKT